MTRVMWAIRAALMAALVAAPVVSAQAPATKAANPTMTIETAKGNIEIELYPADAPKTVEHVTALAKRNFYNGLRVHRVEPGFVVQFGDPQTRDMTKRALWGTRGSGRPVGVGELKRIHRLGSVAMAHGGDPKGADAQMYILMSNGRPSLDGKYSVFGQVTSGMDVVRKLVDHRNNSQPDIIRRVTVKP
jgi:cyclophilin family peptidyl-prolyl cis-trans isomerase